MAYWTGDEWRWRVDQHPRPSHHTISVFEPSDEARREREEKVKADARVVPFGFGRVLATDPPPVEPQVWEGDNG